MHSNQFHNDVPQLIWRRPEKLSRIIILYDVACPHMANFTKAALESLGWEIMNHPPCSPDLAPCDFYLFESKKVHLGQTFETDKHEHSGLNWLRSQDKTFYAPGIINLLVQWENCVILKGECLEEE